MAETGPRAHAARSERSDVRIVLITAPDESTATALARSWVERGLVACVNVIPGVRSIYSWQGSLEESRECVMVVKTTSARVADLEVALASGHPYEVAEFVVLTPEHVAPKYGAWVRDSCARPPRSDS